MADEESTPSRQIRGLQTVLKTGTKLFLGRVPGEPDYYFRWARQDQKPEEANEMLFTEEFVTAFVHLYLDLGSARIEIHLTPLTNDSPTPQGGKP